MADSGHCWHASLNEHRTAWVVACCCIATIFLASIWPDLFKSGPALPLPVQTGAQPASQQETRSSAPAKEASRKQPGFAPDTNMANTAVIRKIKPVDNSKPRQAKPATEPEKIVATAGNYFVQAGAFKEIKLAQKLVYRMKEHGWHAIIVLRSGFHAVWVGPENSRSGIENLQKSINNTLKIKGFIVQKKSS